MRKLLFIQVFILFLLLISWRLAAANTFWASPSGGAGATCTDHPTDPGSYQTLAQGVACLVAGRGDTLMLTAGTYTSVSGLSPASGTASAHTVIKRVAGASVVINAKPFTYQGGTWQYVEFSGNGSCCLVFDGTSMGDTDGMDYGPNAINNFVNYVEIRNWLHNGIGGGAFITVTNSLIHDNGKGGATCNQGACYGWYMGGTGNNLLETSEIYNNGGYGIHLFNTSGNNNNNVVRRNRIHNNGAQCQANGLCGWSGLVIGAGGGGAGAHNNLAYNNLVYDEPYMGITIYGLALNTGVYNNTVYNSGQCGLISDDGTGGSPNPDSSNIFQNNISRNSGLPDTCLSTGSTVFNNNATTATANITFVNAATHDFHLVVGSTGAIGVATVLNSIFTTDFDLVVRGAAWDLGAYEFTAGGLPTLVVKSVSGVGTTCDAGFTTCTVSGNANNNITITGTSSQTGGSVTWACVDVTPDNVAAPRCTGTGATTGTVASWTTSQITLLSGINLVRITGTDASSNIGFVNISITFVPTFPGNALAGAWGLEEGSGTTAGDASPSTPKNNGSLIATPTWTFGKYGQGVLLNGTSQYINVPDANSLDFTQSFTISIWLQPSVSMNTFKAAVVKNYNMALYASNDGTYCGIGSPVIWFVTNGTSGPSYYACQASPLAANQWTHLAATYDGKSLNLYVNGVLVPNTGGSTGSRPASGYIEPTTNALTIGSSQFGEFFPGVVDEARVYNVALPLTATKPGNPGNTTPGAACDRASESDINYASIIGDMNCGVVALTPPLNLKLSGSVKFSGTGKLGSK